MQQTCAIIQILLSQRWNSMNVSSLTGIKFFHTVERLKATFCSLRTIHWRLNVNSWFFAFRPIIRRFHSLKMSYYITLHFLTDVTPCNKGNKHWKLMVWCPIKGETLSPFQIMWLESLHQDSLSKYVSTRDKLVWTVCCRCVQTYKPRQKYNR